MAIYHASTKPLSRSSGRSAVAAAAYRAGVRLRDHRTGIRHDFTHRAGVLSTDLITPDGGPADRSALWNAAEAAEKRKDARTAREWVIALPVELDAPQRRALAQTFGQALAHRYGVAVDVAVHAPDQAGDQRNHHAHLLTTTRQVTRDASGALVLGEKADIELSDKARRERGLGPAAAEVTAVRGLWADLANTALRQADRTERIDPRSYAARGLDLEATTHLGPKATAQERRQGASLRGDRNRATTARNTQRQILTAPPERVMAEWDTRVQTYIDHKIHLSRHIEARATRGLDAVHARRDAWERAHQATQPTPPTGLFAAFKQKAYSQALDQWQDERTRMQRQFENRERRLNARRQRVAGRAHTLDTQRDSFGVYVAEKGLARQEPELAARVEQIRAAEAEKQAALERSKGAHKHRDHSRGHDEDFGL